VTNDESSQSMEPTEEVPLRNGEVSAWLTEIPETRGSILEGTKKTTHRRLALKAARVNKPYTRSAD